MSNAWRGSVAGRSAEVTSPGAASHTYGIALTGRLAVYPGVISPSAARGLEISFLVLLGTLAAAGVFLLRARYTYPRDVATAAASHQGSR